jgi:hypothetical protein
MGVVVLEDRNIGDHLFQIELSGIDCTWWDSLQSAVEYFYESFDDDKFPIVIEEWKVVADPRKTMCMQYVHGHYITIDDVRSIVG